MRAMYMGFYPTADQALLTHYLLQQSHLSEPMQTHTLSDKGITNLNYSSYFFSPQHIINPLNPLWQNNKIHLQKTKQRKNHVTT